MEDFPLENLLFFQGIIQIKIFIYKIRVFVSGPGKIRAQYKPFFPKREFSLAEKEEKGRMKRGQGEKNCTNCRVIAPKR